MKKVQPILIGNQSSFSASTPLIPFEYAVENQFEAFEWFPDKKENGIGWDFGDMGKRTRRFIKEVAGENHMRLSVHAPWQANPLEEEGQSLLLREIATAWDLGAELFNIHFYAEEGIEAYVQSLIPIIKATAETGMQLAVENTVLTGPEEFNTLFHEIRKCKPTPTKHVGMCLDLGHANLCSLTRNDYLAFMDRLNQDVPIIHVHLHENHGDFDSHLPIFIGPAGRDDTGVRGIIKRLKERGFSGSIILEQWPDPPTILNEARDRLTKLILNYHSKGTN